MAARSIQSVQMGFGQESQCMWKDKFNKGTFCIFYALLYLQGDSEHFLSVVMMQALYG